MACDGGGYNNKKAALIGLLSLFLVAMVTAEGDANVQNEAAAGGTAENAAAGGTAENSASTEAIKTLCKPTNYQPTCEEALSKANISSEDPRELIKAGFHFAIEQLKSAIANSPTLKEAAADPMAKQAVDACDNLMDYAIDDLLISIDKIADTFSLNRMDNYIETLKIWLSGALTFQETCLDGFENVTGDTGEKMRNLLKMSKEMTANGLEMIGEVTSILKSISKWLETPSAERQLEEDNEEEEGSLWVNDRRGLLQATRANLKPNVVVAKDGSGKYKTVNEALKVVPRNSNKTFIIYIKEGVYQEEVVVDKTMTYVMMIGDGPTKTKITGSKNFKDGTPTYKTATVSVIGTNFIGKDLGFENAAGAEKHQAVALMVQSDMSIFYNCRMDGYQDTLLTHAHRQFYRDCTITGTIDFIFGNAAVVFQNCKIFVRKPIQGQQCPVTAQGRTQKKEPTGIVLQNCVISSDPEYFPVRHINKAYLGRPWKQYSRTIVMQSQLDDLIQPEGWLPWMGNFALNTLFYAEFNNRGPGAATQNRVKWRGVKHISAKHALDFTPGLFIRGNPWIKHTGVPYISGMA